MLHTTTRTPEHSSIIADVKRRTKEKGITFKPTPREHHYYFNTPFTFDSKAASQFASLIAPNTFSYIEHLRVISTEYPLSDDILVTFGG